MPPPPDAFEATDIGLLARRPELREGNSCFKVVGPSKAGGSQLPSLQASPNQILFKGGPKP